MYNTLTAHPLIHQPCACVSVSYLCGVMEEMVEFFSSSLLLIYRLFTLSLVNGCIIALNSECACSQWLLVVAHVELLLVY